MAVLMAHAGPEDAASLLEQFVHDVANTPAEVTHLLEEIQAKDTQIMLYKDEISKRDSQLQKWVRLNGGHVLNPKEDAFSRTINECFDKCEILQAEKCGLAEKALIVLERQLRRLDTGLRGLAVREEFPSDWNGPTLLSSSTKSGPSTPAAAANSTTTPTTSGPLQPVSNNAGAAGGLPNIGNAAQIRMAAQAGGIVSSRSSSVGAQSPTSLPRSQRESSSEATKRRRLNASLGTLPSASSNLRQSSLGPGTPKAGTPNPAPSSRAGSAQPSRPNGSQKKAPLGASSRKLAPPQGNRKRSRPSQVKRKDRRNQLARAARSGTPSSAASGSATPSRSTSPTDSTLARNQIDGANNDVPAGSDDEDDEDDNDAEVGEDGEDTTLYCFCQKVSFGDMVGCDNDNCKYQWFHWGCVNLKHEPEGEWLCPECRKLPRSQIAVSK